MQSNDREPAIVWIHCECENKGACSKCDNRGYYFNPEWLRWFSENKAMPAKTEVMQTHHRMRTDQQMKNRRKNKKHQYKRNEGDEYHEAFERLASIKRDRFINIHVL